LLLLLLLFFLLLLLFLLLILPTQTLRLESLLQMASPPLGDDDREQWRSKLLEYYSSNAPAKAVMVTDAMMDKWAGKYEELYANMVEKYGPLGSPIVPKPAPKARPAATADPAGYGKQPAAGGKQSGVAEFRDEFVKLVAVATAAIPTRSSEAAPSLVDAKSNYSANGLETSTFTLCTRIRPTLPHEEGRGGEYFTCIVPGESSTSAGGERTEAALVLTPKVSMTGAPKLEKTSFAFDYTFGPDSTNDEVYAAIGAPLARRALAGSVGVVFAYGQTGSGKTHTMNGLLDGIIGDLYADATAEQRQIKFSYLEVQGESINDCLADLQAGGSKGSAAGKGATGVGAVKIGEALDGRVMTRNLSEHVAGSRAELVALVGVAQSRRRTEATEKNDTSSRSHGVAILEVGPLGSGSGSGLGDLSPGRLYIIDLAGSERAADSKEHSKARMEETKAINLSLMSLKECIRARTMASRPGGGLSVHVPYRRSKLTLLMKDVFDIGCARLCATVVIAAVSPLAQDVAHSTNTLQYAAPLRVAVGVSQVPIELDPRDPVLWTQEQMCSWLSETAAIASDEPGSEEPVPFDAQALFGLMSGMQVCLLAESEFHKRVQSQVPGAAGGGLAKRLYAALWMLIVDAKTRKRSPNGRLITEAEETAAKEASEVERAEKQELWKDREKQLATERSFN